MANILSTLFGGDTAAKPITAVGNALDSLFTSDDEKLTHQELLARIAQQPDALQAAITQTQGTSTNWFIAGARPFIMWVCGVALAFFFICNPLIQWITDKVGPDLPVSDIVNLTYGILGIGGTLRTIEKIKGVAR